MLGRRSSCVGVQTSWTRNGRSTTPIQSVQRTIGEPSRSGGGPRRMRLFLATIKLDGGSFPLFVTTTYPDIFPTETEQYKRNLKTLLERMKRRFPNCAAVWRMEFKRRLTGTNAGMVAPHFHLLVFGGLVNSNSNRKTTMGFL